MSNDGWTVEAALAKLREALKEKGMSVDEMFASFDADSDGTINGPELHFGIKNLLGDVLSPAHISDIIVALDANEDNRIDLEEPFSLSEEEERGVAPCPSESALPATASVSTPTWGSWSVSSTNVKTAENEW